VCFEYPLEAFCREAVVVFYGKDNVCTFQVRKKVMNYTNYLLFAGMIVAVVDDYPKEAAAELLG
jgi:hypothetical protein